MLDRSRLSIAVAVLLAGALLFVPVNVVRAQDTEPPWVPSHYPVNGMNNVPLSARIYVNFSEPMNQPSVSVDIMPFVALTPSWDMTGQSVILSHAVSYMPNTWYTVTVDGNDLAGNPLDGDHDGIGGDPLVWTFMSSCGRCILSTDPYDGEQNVGLNRQIVVTFSQRMDSAMLTVNVIPSLTFTPDWDFGFIVLTMIHAAPFQTCTNYRVTIGGVSLDPGPVPNPWQFTTTGCPPVITGISPPQVDAALDAPIRVDFSTTMNNATVTWTLNRTVILASIWNFDNTTLNLTHDVRFLPCTGYGFSITGDDMFGQVLDNGSFPMPYNFTTVCTYPRVTDTSPDNTQNNVQLDASIIVTFSESMDNLSVMDSFTYNVGVTIYTKSNGTSAWNPDNTIFTFTPSSPFRVHITYTVTLNSNVARGLGNNHLDGNGNGVPEGRPTDDVEWQFTTVQVNDAIPPTVQTVSPGRDAMHVPRTTAIVVMFSEAMDRPSVEHAITVLEGNVAYGFNWPDNRTVSFSLTPNLMLGTAYHITMKNTASDLVGNRMISDYDWTFTTEYWRGDVHGRVVDDADGSPISNATVTLDGTQTLTDENGNFTFGNVEQGTYALNVMKDGYDSNSDIKSVGQGALQDLGTIRLRKTQGGQSNMLFVAGTGIIIAVVIVLILLVLLSRRRKKIQPTTFEQWKGEVAEVERPDSGQ
jgi:hypothetical protein